MTEFDFTGLTENQAWLLTFGGWTRSMKNLSVQPSRMIVKKLLERGLLIEHETEYPGWGGPLKVREYVVPNDVHMAWCAWCSENEIDP
jgi:hypothetical protein